VGRRGDGLSPPPPTTPSTQGARGNLQHRNRLPGCAPLQLAGNMPAVGRILQHAAGPCCCSPRRQNGALQGPKLQSLVRGSQPNSQHPEWLLLCEVVGCCSQLQAAGGLLGKIVNTATLVSAHSGGQILLSKRQVAALGQEHSARPHHPSEHQSPMTNPACQPRQAGWGQACCSAQSGEGGAGQGGSPPPCTLDNITHPLLIQPASPAWPELGAQTHPHSTPHPFFPTCVGATLTLPPACVSTRQMAATPAHACFPTSGFTFKK